MYRGDTPPCPPPSSRLLSMMAAVKTGATSVYCVHIRKCLSLSFFFCILELIHNESKDPFNTTLNTCDTGTHDTSTIPSRCRQTGPVSRFSLPQSQCPPPTQMHRWPANLVDGSQSLSRWRTNHLSWIARRRPDVRAELESSLGAGGDHGKEMHNMNDRAVFFFFFIKWTLCALPLV